MVDNNYYSVVEVLTQLPSVNVDTVTKTPSLIDAYSEAKKLAQRTGGRFEVQDNYGDIIFSFTGRE